MKITKVIRRYMAVLIALAIMTLLLIIYPELSSAVTSSLIFQTKTMLLIIPPIFVLLGLMDIWVPRETMMRLMGPGSGIKGPLIGFFLGSAAAGPLYGAFPIAAILMKKGASFTNILIFIGSWSTTKIPMLLFEMKALGVRFALSRLAIDIAGIIIIALALKALVPKKEVKRLYESATLMV